jgi:predicted metal-dependent hydrolase
MPWGSEGRLHLEDYDALSLVENHRLGIEHFDAQRFFPAHEAWETCWKQTKETADAEFFKGLSQLGAGYVHLLRGNPHGAHTLLRRGAGRIRRYEDGHRGIPTEALSAAAFAHAQRIETAEEAGEPMPEVEFPKI